MPRCRRLAPGIVLVRPLLGVTRAEIRAHLGAIGQGFREDSTNLDTTRTRARIRLELIPELASKYNPDVAGALVRLGRLARSADRAIEAVSRERLAALMVESGPDRVALDRRKLFGIKPFGRVEVLRLAWRGAGWPEGGMGSRGWRRLAALARFDSARVSVGAGVEAEATSDRLILIRRPPSVPEIIPRRDPIPLPMPGSVEVPGGRVVATLDPVGAEAGTRRLTSIGSPSRWSSAGPSPATDSRPWDWRGRPSRSPTSSGGGGSLGPIEPTCPWSATGTGSSGSSATGSAIRPG